MPKKEGQAKYSILRDDIKNLFKEFSESIGVKVDMNQLFSTLYNKALEGDADCGGLLAYNYFSGEHVTGFEEGVKLDKIYGHRGLFKTKGVGQKIMAAAIDVPVPVMETAGEGGAWGMALLASFMKNKKGGETLDDYLRESVFAGQEGTTIAPDTADVAGFEEFIKRYSEGLSIERAA